MNDIRLPKKSEQGLKQPLLKQPPVEPAILSDAISDKSSASNKRLWLKRHKPLAILLGVLSLLILGLLLFLVWYLWALSPVNSSDLRHDRVEIAAGSSPGQIAETLRGKKLIRSSVAFDIYTRLTGTKSNLQAGIYSISPSESTPKIVDKLTSGDITDEQVDITFYPGATLVDNSATAENKKLDVKTVLKRAGYSDSEITAAFDKTYTGPLFAGKPAGSDIEGYVYGDTYKFNKNATVEQILQRTFDEFYGVVQKNDLVDKFKSHGLNLYQGITLASIVQREAHNANDQKQVAQVFYSRLAIGMQLGSDVTYQYIADKLGVPRDTNLDSPYNTRRYVGLPPGPIATPGLSALMAVAEPAEGDYLYFLAGDDGKVYFAHTNAEHELNIQKHCQIGCSTL